MTRRRTPADPADAPAFRAARDVCRRHAKDFYFASAFLPPAKRDAAHAVYAFSRMIGQAMDVAEGDEATVGASLRHRPLSVTPIGAGSPGGGAGGGCCSPNSLDQRLALFRDRLNDLYDGRIELPSVAGRSQEHHVLHAFSVAARRYQIPRQYFLDLAEGHRMDQSVVRYATWASLGRYCHHAGGAAALTIACVFGVTNCDAVQHAAKAGVAISLTKMLCNLGQDTGRGRVYLPLEDLAAFRYGERDLAHRVVNDNFRKLMRFEINRARRLYQEAAEGLRWVAGDGSRLAASTVLSLKSGVLDAIERQGYDVFARRPGLTRAQKFRRLPLAWRLARRRPGSRLPAEFHPDALPLAPAR